MNEVVPRSRESNLLLTERKRYLKIRTMNPTMNDVLSGRGARFNQHPGNKRFRSMLEEKKVRVTQHFHPDFLLNLIDEIRSLY